MKEEVLTTYQIEQNPLEIIDGIIGQENTEMGSAIKILQKVQASFGYVSSAMLERISQLTGISTSELYSIITFYAQFRLEPIGENLIQVCHGTACHLAGAEKITEAIELESGSVNGKTSPDGKFTVEKVACLGCCSLAPVININGETYGRMTPEKARQLVREKRNGCSCHPPADPDQG
jgi:NADH-quinone oxidoreductase subunit E